MKSVTSVGPRRHTASHAEPPHVSHLYHRFYSRSSFIQPSSHVPGISQAATCPKPLDTLAPAYSGVPTNPPKILQKQTHTKVT